MRTEVSYTRFVAQQRNSRKPSRHDDLRRIVEFCQNPSIYIFWYYIVTELQRRYRTGTEAVQKGYSGVQMGYRKGSEGHGLGTVTVQRGYRCDTDGVQKGYREDTVGVQKGYRGDTVGVQKGYRGVLQKRF